MSKKFYFNKGDKVRFEGRHKGFDLEFDARVIDTREGGIKIAGKDEIWGFMVIKLPYDCSNLEIIEREDRTTPWFLKSARARWIARMKHNPEKTAERIEKSKKRAARRFLREVYKHTKPKLENFDFDESIDYKKYKIDVMTYKKLIKKNMYGFLQSKKFNYFKPIVKQFI